MASISKTALKSFESLDTNELQPCLFEMLKQIETLHDQVRQTDRDPNSPDFNKTENLLEKARACSHRGGSEFCHELIQFAVGCQTDCDKLFSHAAKELDPRALLQELLKYVENAVASIDSLDVIIGEIINDSLSMAELYSIDDKSKSTAIYNGGISIVRASSVGALFTSVAFAINLPLSMGISVTAAVVAAAVLGVIVGIVAMVMFIRHCSQAIAKYEHLKESTIAYRKVQQLNGWLIKLRNGPGVKKL